MVEGGRSSHTWAIEEEAEDLPYLLENSYGAVLYLGNIGEADSASIQFDLSAADTATIFEFDVSLDPVSICAPW